jgi:hypothetical protein
MAKKPTSAKSLKAVSPRLLSVDEAVQGARNAFAVANASVESQLYVHEALVLAADACLQAGRGADAELYQHLADSRGALLTKVIDRTLDESRAAHERHGQMIRLRRTLRAALAVYNAVDPKNNRLQELKKDAETLDVEPEPETKARPFFARFLENQNRQRASSRQKAPKDIAITLKAPSDEEDRGGVDEGKQVFVTLKFPSDNEDGGPVTEKYPSDEEDAGCDGVVVTRKAPSDHEDRGTDWTDWVFVTLKFPSDHDEGETPPVETRKFPSDEEDTNLNTLAETPVTLKAPSDHEDQIGGQYDPKDAPVVTLKAPSDYEDEGSEVMQTEKFPSDSEDACAWGDGPVTLKFPSDCEDGGHPSEEDVPGNPVTLKFPSDNEDSGSEHVDPPIVTLKYPSDREDGGNIDPGEVVTAKFPSDEEDAGARLDYLHVVTLKFPSDNDEGDPWIDVGSNITTAKFPSDRDEVLT